MGNIICGYDGFKLFIPGRAAIQHLIANFKQFNLYGRYRVDDENNFQLPLPLKGEYLNKDYKLTITATKYNGKSKYKDGQEGVEIKGSFHKLYTGGENYSLYYWDQFEATIKFMCQLFNVNPSSIHIIHLELGLNLQIPTRWGTTAKDIIRNILAYKGSTYKERLEINYNKDGHYLQFSLNQYLLKIYDKAMQNHLENERIFRVEIKVLSSEFLKPFGITTVKDLLYYENHQALSDKLSKLFTHLVIYQNEIDRKLLLPENKVFAWEYSKPKEWEDLHVRNRHEYKYVKNQLEVLINEHCRVNYKEELQMLIASAINEVPKFAP